jgi:cell wall-associated NlpC family hydrolase
LNPRRKATTLALLAAGAVAAIGAPSAAGQAVPWGYSCIPASSETVRTSATCGATLVDGQAVPPPNAPAAVKAAIAAANHIAGRPYVWGGGHLSWTSHGYDCSGAVGFALHGAGLLETTMVSGQLAYWGLGGTGRWMTVYANDEHVYMVIAGLRFDTRDDLPGVSGPRWHTEKVVPRGFAVRHPTGL